MAKTLAAANLFVSVPFVLHALGPVEFGAWATLVSLVVFAGFLDFGFGNGTMNLVAGAHGRGSTDEVAAVIYEGARTLTWIALALAIVVATTLPWVPWYRLLGMPSSSATSCRLASAAVLFAIVVAAPLNMATRVLLGLGRGDQAFRWQALAQLATLGLVVTLAHQSASLPALTAAAVFTPLLAPLANTVFILRDPDLARPPTRHRDLARTIRREGLLFFTLQLAAALAYSADLALISNLRGPAEAGTYSIVQRLFSIVPMGLGLIWVPLWPIYRQALASGKHRWVVRTLRGSIVFAFIAAVSAVLVLSLGFERIIALWVHRPLVVSGTLLAGFAVWTTVDAVGTAFATFLNAASIMRFQVVIASTFSVACIAGKAWAIGRIGTFAVPWVTIATYVIISLVPTVLFSGRLMRTALTRYY